MQAFRVFTIQHEVDDVGEAEAGAVQVTAVVNEDPDGAQDLVAARGGHAERKWLREHVADKVDEPRVQRVDERLRVLVFEKLAGRGRGRIGDRFEAFGLDRQASQQVGER